MPTACPGGADAEEEEEVEDEDEEDASFCQVQMSL